MPNKTFHILDSLRNFGLSNVPKQVRPPFQTPFEENISSQLGSG